MIIGLPRDYRPKFYEDIQTQQQIHSNTIMPSNMQLTERGLPPTKFDAFILFHNDDIAFATMLIEKLEESGLKIFVKERDLLAGSLECDATMCAVAERCDRVIALFSKAFFSKHSNLDHFLLQYAQAIGVEQRRRKIVPVYVDDNFQTPAQFSIYYKLRYRPEKIYNFWERLRNSVRSAPVMAPATTAAQAHASKLKMIMPMQSNT